MRVSFMVMHRNIINILHYMTLLTIPYLKIYSNIYSEKKLKCKRKIPVIQKKVTICVW